jgi:hypothetical protein
MRNKTEAPRKFSGSIQSFQPVIWLSAQVGDRHNPDLIRLLQINDAERKSFRLPTPRAEFPGMSECEIVLNFRQGFVNGV